MSVSDAEIHHELEETRRLIVPLTARLAELNGRADQLVLCLLDHDGLPDSRPCGMR